MHMVGNISYPTFAPTLKPITYLSKTKRPAIQSKLTLRRFQVRFKHMIGVDYT